MTTKIKYFIKKDPVLIIALILAVFSMFYIPPNMGYLNYIDFRVLAILFCLMTIVAGLQNLGFFRLMGEYLTASVKTIGGLNFALVFLCFFTSMVITNDVALITFVPFTIFILNQFNLNNNLIKIVVLETIAANLGSMLTPIGNPQNLYLFSLSGMSLIEFITLMLPITVISAVAIAIIILTDKHRGTVLNIAVLQHEKFNFNKLFFIYLALFFICMCDILHILNYKIVFLIVVVSITIFDIKIFKSVDYSLLITFLGFFIFVGNIGKIDFVRNFMETIVSTNVLATGILFSQIISNVPAAMLLSEFTADYSTLLWGVNIGGLGTLIASMASVISYKYYAATKNSKKGKYIATFTIYNIGILALLWFAGIILK